MAFPNYDSEYFFDHYHLQHHSVVNNVGHFMPQADFYSGWPTDGTYLSTQFMDTSTHWHDFSIKTDHRFAAHWTEPFFNASLPYQHSVFEIPPTDQKIHSCLTCHKQCCRKNLKPFICQACGKKFSQAANLTAHKRVHTGEKPFSCPVCLRPFSQSSSLVTHKKTHTGEKPYPCNQCDKAFTDSSTRTKHLRTHTGQKPYQCHLCLMRFTQSGNLHRHIKTHRDENLCEDNNK